MPRGSSFRLSEIELHGDISEEKVNSVQQQRRPPRTFLNIPSLLLLLTAVSLPAVASSRVCETESAGLCQAQSIAREGDDVVAMMQHSLMVDQRPVHLSGAVAPKKPTAFGQFYAGLHTIAAAKGLGQIGIAVIILAIVLSLVIGFIAWRATRPADNTPEDTFEAQQTTKDRLEQKELQKDQWQDRWISSGAAKQTTTTDPFLTGPVVGSAVSATSWPMTGQTPPAQSMSMYSGLSWPAAPDPAAAAAPGPSYPSGRRSLGPQSAGSLSGAFSPQFGSVVPPAQPQQYQQYQQYQQSAAPAGALLPPFEADGDGRNSLLDAVRAARESYQPSTRDGSLTGSLQDNMTASTMWRQQLNVTQEVGPRLSPRMSSQAFALRAADLCGNPLGCDKG